MRETRALRQREPEPVYRELVDALADNVVPMVVLCGMTIATGIHIWSITPSVPVAVASLFCAITMVVKIATIMDHQRHRARYRAASLARVRFHEAVHGATTIVVCLSISAFSVAIYALPEPELHSLPIAITFGYSAGLIARASIRPYIAGSGILCLIIPNALAMVILLPGHLFVALILGVFAIAGLQCVVFVHATVRRAVTLRLELEGLARRDPLTGLLNRLGLYEAFEAMVAGGAPSIVVHALDLDRFKRVNDRFGHLVGDELLVLVAARIEANLGAGTIAARTGGDEFVVVQPGDAAAAKALANRLHSQLTRPCDLGQSELISIGLSLGYAVGSWPDTSLDGLIQQADARSYEVKRAGGGVRGVDDGVPPPPVARPPAALVSRPA